MKKIFVILAAAALAFSANAQEANENLLIGNAGSNWFISVNGGVNFMYNAKSWSKPTNPAVAINLGKWFTPAIGFRVGYLGIKDTNPYGKTWFSGSEPFGYNLAHLDAMWNIANTANYKLSRVWNPILYVRGGAAFLNYKNVTKPGAAGGLGLLNQFRLGNRVSLAIDLSAVTTNEDNFHVKNVGRFATFITATGGLVFDLGPRGFNAPEKGLDPALLAAAQDKLAAAEKRAQQADATIVGLNRELSKYNDLVNGKVYEYQNGNFTETVVKESTAMVPEILYFDLGKATLTGRELARLEYYAENTFKKDQKLLVTGCADLGTGTKEANDRLSKQRAEYVKNVLVNQFGYNAANIETKADVMPGDAPIKGRIVTIEVQ